MKKVKNTLFAVLAAAVVVSFAPGHFALAHEADCPYCQQPVTQDTATQDNEVVLKYGRKRIEYKCVYCALAEAKTEYPEGDVTIAAPSEIKGEPVILKRVDGKWNAPETAVFVAITPLKHKTCNVTARAFSSDEAAKEYIKVNVLETAPLTLSQLLKIVK